LHFKTDLPATQQLLDFSLGAAREIGCEGPCRVTVRRAGYEQRRRGDDESSTPTFDETARIHAPIIAERLAPLG